MTTTPNKESAPAAEQTATNDTTTTTPTEVDDLTAAVQKISVQDDEIPSSLQKVADWIQDGKVKRIIVLSGAGVSVSAGIPDFRSPGTGLYDNLQKYNLPYPEAVFDVDFYKSNPAPFCSLAAEIWPGRKHAPTLTHSFVSLLAKNNLLLRNYSQNIDGLEYLAGIPPERLVECHGHFRTATCTSCGAKADADAVKHTIVEQAAAPVCRRCDSYVKPDIVFFGEGLPDRFHTLLKQDLPVADMVLILGTSLQVAPVSMIPDMVGRKCKRVLLNRELVGDLDLDDDERDLFHAGDCDAAIQQLAAALGWQDDLLEWNTRVTSSIAGSGSSDESATTSGAGSVEEKESSS